MEFAKKVLCHVWFGVGLFDSHMCYILRLVCIRKWPLLNGINFYRNDDVVHHPPPPLPAGSMHTHETDTFLLCYTRRVNTTQGCEISQFFNDHSNNIETFRVGKRSKGETSLILVPKMSTRRSTHVSNHK